MPLRIVADENMPLTEVLFGDLGEVRRVGGRTLTRSDLTVADVLLVRSVTRVDRELLEGTPVRFVGSATIGTDHVDLDWLKHQGITFAAAPGCNATSVVQYVLSVLALWCLDNGRAGCGPEGLRAGIVGGGNVGGRLASVLARLGVDVIVSDPPRQQAGLGTPGRYGSLDDVLSCDLISLHTPLTRSGPWPTLHLLDDTRLDRLDQRQLLINSGRGPVIDNSALNRRLQASGAPRVALDVWEREPQLSVELASRCWLASPHIAGYSAEGKARGTFMVYEALCRELGAEAQATLAPLLPTPDVTEVTVNLDDESPWQAVSRALLTGYDPSADDQRLRATLSLPAEQRWAAFDQLRKHYPLRREPDSLAVRLHGGSAGTRTKTARMLRAVGFMVAD